jgi:aquaporin Z
MPIRIYSGNTGILQLQAAFKKNWRHYLQEGLGLAIFMVSACFFGAMFFSDQSPLKHLLPGGMAKDALMGLIMGLTALFIFYSPFTAPSGSQINPAVTITFLRLDKMCRYDALFFIIFQIIGGTVAVYAMQFLMGEILTAAPVHSVATVPGKYGMWAACATEFIIAFITMTMVLFTSNHERLKKYTRVFAVCLVYVRSFASALPSGVWTSFWIYLLMPFAGMLSAAEFYLQISSAKWKQKLKVVHKGQV